MNEANDNGVYYTSLYKYGNEFLLNALWEGEIKLANALDLNDPFEFFPYPEFSNEDERDKYEDMFSKSFQKRSSENYYILSLSRLENNNRMWAQYGNNHKGVMIEFCFPEEGCCLSVFDKNNPVYFRDVDTTGNSRYTIDFHEFMNEKDDVNLTEIVVPCFFKKSPDWKEEKEVRLVLPETFFRDKDFKVYSRLRILNGRLTRFLPFNHAWVKSVTVGYKSDPSIYYDLLKIKKFRQASWNIYKLERDSKTFSLISK